MAASLHAVSALYPVRYHEYQHSVFNRNLKFSVSGMACENAAYAVPSGPSRDIVPADEICSYCI